MRMSPVKLEDFLFTLCVKMSVITGVDERRLRWIVDRTWHIDSIATDRWQGRLAKNVEESRGNASRPCTAPNAFARLAPRPRTNNLVRGALRRQRRGRVTWQDIVSPQAKSPV